MEKATIIGGLAKRVFQLHGVTGDGGTMFRKRVSRGRLLSFLAAQPRTVVAMEACATAHDWGRAIAELGHEVRLIPPVYVKPFVRRQKNDAAAAEAIAEAASRPSMRFGGVEITRTVPSAIPYCANRNLLKLVATGVAPRLTKSWLCPKILAPISIAAVAGTSVMNC